MKIIGIIGKKGVGKDAVCAAMMAADPAVRRIALADSLKRTACDLFGFSYAQVHGTQEEKEAVDPRWGKSPRQILQVLGTEVGRQCHPDVWIHKMKADIEDWERTRLGWRYISRETHETNMAPHWGRVLDTSITQEQGGVIWIVPDVRFQNEADAIREWGGVVLRVARRPTELTVSGGRPHGNSATWTCPHCGATYRGLTMPLDGVTPVEIWHAYWHNAGCIYAHASEVEQDSVIADYEFINDLDGLQHVDYWARHYLNRAKQEKGWGAP